jgi:hypothetical protein
MPLNIIITGFVRSKARLLLAAREQKKVFSSIPDAKMPIWLARFILLIYRQKSSIPACLKGATQCES